MTITDDHTPTTAQIVDGIIERFNLCTPEQNNPWGDYRNDHGHTDCWILGLAIEKLTIAQRVEEAERASINDPSADIEFVNIGWALHGDTALAEGAED